MERRSTGVDVLDRRLGGGIPAGSVVALVAPPDSGSELLVSAVAGAHSTTHASLLRPPEAVESPAEVRRFDPDDLLDDPDSLPAPSEGGVLVVDPVNDLERDPGRYDALLDAVRERVRASDAVALLHAYGDDDPSARWRTLARADLTWRLEVLAGPLTVESRLVVSKFRGGRALDEPLKLKLTDRVAVDTSRDIS